MQQSVLMLPGIVIRELKKMPDERGFFCEIFRDDANGSMTRDEISEIVSSGEKLRLVKIPGHYWHGFKAIGNEPVMLVYFVNRLYDYGNPDEERRPWNNHTIVDSRTGRAFDWNKLPYR